MHLGCLLWTGIGNLFWVVLEFIFVSSFEAQWKANILRDKVPPQPHGPDLMSISDEGLSVENRL